MSNLYSVQQLNFRQGFGCVLDILARAVVQQHVVFIYGKHLDFLNPHPCLPVGTFIYHIEEHPILIDPETVQRQFCR